MDCASSAVTLKAKSSPVSRALVKLAEQPPDQRHH